MFKALNRVFDYSGRSTRWEYWSFAIGTAIILMLTGAWVANYQSGHYGLEPQLSDQDAAVLSLAVVVIIVAPGLSLRVRRYHDFGWSGWAVLWLLVPFVNVFMEFMLLFRGPTPEPVAYPVEHEPRAINIYNTPSAGVAGPARSAGNHIDQIARLADMRAQGVLTAEEFAAAKARVLRS